MTKRWMAGRGSTWRTAVGGGLVAATMVVSGVAGIAAQDATPDAIQTPSGADATPEGVAGAATATALQAGSLTQARPYLVPAEGSSATITPILTSGETVGDYQMAGVPDGLGAYRDGDEVVLYVNHELTPEEDENLSAARVSRLVLDPTTGAVKSGRYVLDGTEGYERLCSASLAGPEVGFDQPLFLTGEEATGGPKGGLVLGIDGATGKVTEMPWLGHFAHENQIVVPGFQNKTVVLLGDDNSEGSELYLYEADSPADVLAGKGQLYVFKGDNATGTTDVAKGAELTGSFVPVDQASNVDPETLQNAVDQAGAFRFVRVEDVTYDRTNTTTVYFADTGDNAEPNVATPTDQPLTANGRVYSMTLDPSDPTKVTGFKVVIDGDAGDDVRNPDNLDATASTILIQEDLNGYNRAENSEAVGRILAYDIASGSVTPVAQIDQSDDPNRLVDAGDKAGSWESSGIIDVSSIFGEGTFLVDVQAHSLNVPQFGKEDEGGQILLLKTS
jgi:secreted PhoX family phosphatase